MCTSHLKFCLISIHYLSDDILVYIMITLSCTFLFCFRSYCERVFRDCRLQTCYVQSPAYPGIYPRHLHCSYHLNTRLPFIKLYIENEEFNIDGQRCENIMTCPMRPISSGIFFFFLSSIY